jgi:hypothetical protein
VGVQKGLNMEEQKEFRQFCREMAAAVQEKFPPEVTVEVRRITKNNSLELDSLVILSEKHLLSPNFYLQWYYEEYKEGAAIKALADQIQTLYQEAVCAGANQEVDLSYERCADRIVFRLVSYEQNKKMLQTVPYIRFLDLAIIFYIVVRKDEKGVGSIRVNQQLMEEWGLDLGAVFTLARENTERLFPEKMCSMEAVMKQILSEEREEAREEKGISGIPKQTAAGGEPYVLTNDSGINGAAVILYPNTLKRVGEILEKDFYLLPSSIHEMIIIPQQIDVQEAALYDMVSEVNQSCVAQDEILSDSVYCYEREEESIRICTKQ